MGFGKFLLGGACAVGAIIAAPVVLPAAGLTAGMAVAGASSTTAAVVAGAAGVAVGTVQKKKVENAYNKGWKEGAEKVSYEYEEKIRKMEEEWNRIIEEYKTAQRKDAVEKDKLKKIAEEMYDYIQSLERKRESIERSGGSAKEMIEESNRVALKRMEVMTLLAS